MKTCRLCNVAWCLFLVATVGVAAEHLYTRFNLHYYARGGDTLIASYANYIDCPGHAFLPTNTVVELSPWRGGFALTVFDTNQRIYFEYHQPRMGMDVAEYQSILFATNKVSYAGLSDVDREGIEQGKALRGMSKLGVKIALGYPATHRTPSLDSDMWIYWKNRFVTTSVRFEEGKVVSVR